MSYPGPDDAPEIATVGNTTGSPSPQSIGPFCRAVGMIMPSAGCGRHDCASATDASVGVVKSINPRFNVFASAAAGSAGASRIAMSPRLYFVTVHGIGPCPSYPTISTFPLNVVLPRAITFTALTDVFGNGPGAPPPSGTTGVGPAGAAAAILAPRLRTKMGKSLSIRHQQEFFIRVWVR